MRRRTKKKNISPRRAVIYLTIFAMIWLADYVYTNYIEPQQEQIENITNNTSAKTSLATEEPASANTPAPPKSKEQKSEAATKSSNKTASKGKTYRSGWAELPAAPTHKELYATHHLHAEGQRNFSVCFSSKHHCPVWVAAPLHKSYKGDVKRHNSFTLDPTLSIDLQPLLTRSFGEYTRGHLLGSAERTASREMNEQTFYATNIAPQLQSGFNAAGGAWNNTEKAVDKQICSDTLYVVTGCIFEDYTHADGRVVKASTTVNKNDNKLIGVPTAYYKAMLRTKRGTTGKSVTECSADELKCAAIIVPHLSASGYKPSKTDLISIKELEKLSGVEFFANVENAPKGRVNPSEWGF